jgi:hypothetical protein
MQLPKEQGMVPTTMKQHQKSIIWRSADKSTLLFLLLIRPGKSFKESRQKNWAGGAIEEHLGRRLGETTSFIDTSYCCGHFVGTRITQIFPGFLVATWELKCGHFLGTKITQIFPGVFW